ncbi:MAG: tRNA-dihydrouridine synthase family protein [Bacteroidales bacterium]|nr:tRNA-dihydrouridine synthase family protein [Bacteroidales bacterium]
MRLWLAPLDGITNYQFRNCLCRHFGGIDNFIAPFLPVQERAKLNVKKWKDLWPNNNACRPLTPQLMGNNPAHFVDTMNELYREYGYTDFNWNIGCPVAQVVRRTRGCGVMPHPEIVEDVVRTVTEQTPFRFSLKMRLGLHNKSECLEILDRMQNYPLDYVVIHPRLGEQLYEGVPDWDALERALQHTSHRVIYSGDVWTLEDYERLHHRFPDIHDWMLGRPLLCNPFLAEEMKGMDSGDKKERFLRYYQRYADELLETKKEKSTLFILKELWHYYASFAGIDASELKTLLRINDFNPFFELSLQYLTATS